MIKLTDDPNVKVIGKVWQSYEVYCSKCKKKMDLMVRVKEKEITFVCRDCNIESDEVKFINTQYKIKLIKVIK